MRLSFTITSLLTTIFLFTTTFSQDRPNKKMGVFPDARRVVLVHGDVLRVDCDSAFVYNRQAVVVLRTLERTNDSLFSALSARIALGDSIKALKDSVIAQLREIDSIQNLSYAQLHSRFDAADTLVRASVANTKEALFLVRKVRLTSFVASGFVGGITGGLGIKSSSNEVFNWWGALGGAVVGLGINWAIQKIID